MAARARPTVLLVFAILNIVFGSLALLVNLCCLAPGGGVLLTLGNVTPQNLSPAEMRNIQTAQAFLFEMGVVACVSAAIGTILAVMELVSGIGLIGVKSWARWMAVLWAVGAIGFNIANAGYTIAILQPRIQKFEADAARMGRPGQQNPFSQSSNPMANTVGTLVGSGLGCVYAVIVVVVLFLPNVSEAFAANSGGARYRRRRQEEDEEEEEEEERPRRRRRPADDDDE